MADFDKAVPPGGEGVVRLRVETKGYSGPKHWNAKVYTNDPEKKIVELHMKAFVKSVVALSSRYVFLNGIEGKSVHKDVVITAGLKRPLTLQPMEFNLDPVVTYRIVEVEKGRRFRITFASRPNTQKSYKGYLKLKTNYQEKPEITIWVRGRGMKPSN